MSNQETETDWSWAFVHIAVFIAGIAIAMIGTNGATSRNWMTEAVKKGHARWTVTADGAVGWEWLNKCADQDVKEPTK